VINSPVVCFSITRQCAQVGCKNLITFGWKNHLCRSGRDGKTLLEKDLHHTFVQFLAQELVVT
jgi:hypothetical protein